jgi:hypothetical protein
MNWAKTMTAYGSVTSSRRYTVEPGETTGELPEGWNPYEVWLTRIKQPRERAARLVNHGVSSCAASATDLAPAI